jgi:hypothetical protein
MSARSPLVPRGGSAAAWAFVALLLPTTPARAALPLHFEPNRGQHAEPVRFASRSRDGALLFLPRETVLVLGGERPASLRMRWLGADPRTEITGESPLAARVNYIRGADPQRWRTNIPTFARVRCANLYPGIDVAYYGRDGDVEHDLVVAPGADPARARLELVGAESLVIDARGDLVAAVGGRTVRLDAPVSYQDRDGERHAIASRWVLDGKRRAHVAVGAYDRSRTLVIDPVIRYSTFLGGNDEDNGGGLHVDASGITLGGNTTSTDLPAPNGTQPANAGGFDSYLAKLDPTGATLLYATYFGGGGDDTERDLVVDAAGDAYLFGETDSTDLPTTLGAFDRTCGSDGACGGGLDTFVAKFDGSDGSLLWSTYVGGAGSDVGGKIAVDAGSSLYLSAYTNSSDLPATDGAFDTTCGTDGTCNETCEGETCSRRRDCFAAKLVPDGSALAYLTYLGGSAFDRCFGIDVDASGRAIVVGSTFSADFPATDGAYDTTCGTDGACDTTCVEEVCTTADDAFVAMFDASGSNLVYGTFLGGSGNGDTAIDEYAWAVDADASGRARVVGQTDSADFPTPNGAWPSFGGNVLDAFVVDLDPTGSTLAFGTYLGGAGVDQGLAIAVDALGRIHVAGVTTSIDFPQVDALAGPGNACENCQFQFTEAFVTTLDATGENILFSSFLGGSNSDYGSSLALDGTSTLYVAGDAASTDFPLVAPFQAAHGVHPPPDTTNYDAFVTRIPEPSGVALAAAAALALHLLAARWRC